MAKMSDVDKQIAVVDGEMSQEEANKPDYDPIYKQYENTRIPVSKSMGKMWKLRKNESQSFIEKRGIAKRWDEAIAYYQNDQGGRDGKRHRLDELGDGEAHTPKFATENIIFANVSALLPATYAKNPDTEITSNKSAQEPNAKLFERLIDILFARKQAPGINIKPKMRKVTLNAILTNVGYLELKYVQKEDSTEEAIREIETLSKELAKAKDIDTIQEIEGKLLALEKRVNILAPAGPSCHFRQNKHVILPANAPDDIVDCDWVMIGEYIRTDTLREEYGRKNSKGEWESIYKPTHIIAGDRDSQGHDEEINHFSLLGEGAEHENYGYKNKEEFEHNCHTLCWFVWDKVTRRVFLFHNDDWSWPIWVWDDPYKLTRFYPVFELKFYTDPTDRYGRSEVMYYMDQQDEINEVNNERARMRHWAMSKVFVNTDKVRDRTAIEKFLRSESRDLVYGLSIGDNKISDVIGAFPLPSTQFEQLFETRSSLESINRMSSVTPVLQNVQYKTNTTNRAIESYESSTQMRLDEKIDAIEEMLGDIGHALLEMCVQFMSEDEVKALLGDEYVQAHGGWFSGQEVTKFNQEFSLHIVGGSTLKPTSKVKKEQAMQMGQVLGQFANASPGIIIVLLKMLERAFGDDFIITPEEWNAIIESTSQQMQRGGPGQGQEGGGQPAQQQQEGQPTEDNAVMAGLMEKVSAIIDRLPPQAKQALGEGLAQGIPLKQLVAGLVKQAQQQPARQQ